MARTRLGPGGGPSLPYGDFSGKQQQTGGVGLGLPEWPDIPIRNFRIDLNEGKTITESLFTRQRQVMSLAGGTSDRWEGLITTPLLRPSQVREAMNFLVEVGLYGRFLITHPDYDGPSSGVETGTVDGAGQRGATLDLKDATPSITIAHEGDWFQVDDEFKRLTADVVSDGSGDVTLTFKPPLRVSPADNASVEFKAPRLLAELTTIPGEETDSLRMMAFTISFQEAFVT